jgi:hypothetical protein
MSCTCSRALMPAMMLSCAPLVPFQLFSMPSKLSKGSCWAEQGTHRSDRGSEITLYRLRRGWGHVAGARHCEGQRNWWWQHTCLRGVAVCLCRAFYPSHRSGGQLAGCAPAASACEPHCRLCSPCFQACFCDLGGASTP